MSAVSVFSHGEQKRQVETSHDQSQTLKNGIPYCARILILCTAIFGNARVRITAVCKAVLY
jgi:hypothetical protein